MSSQNRFKSFNHLMSKTPPNINRAPQYRPCTHTPAADQNQKEQFDTPIKDLMNIKKNKIEIQQKIRSPAEFNKKSTQKRIQFNNNNKCMNCIHLCQQNNQLKVKINQISKILNQQLENSTNFQKNYKLAQRQLQIYRSQKQNFKQFEQNLKRIKTELDILNKKNRELLQENAKINIQNQQKNFILEQIQIKYEKIQNQLKSKEDQIINYKWIIQKLRDEDEKFSKNRAQSSNKSSLETSVNSDKKKRSQSITSNKKDVSTIKQNKIGIDLNKLWTNGLKNYNNFVVSNNNNSKVFLYK